MAINPNFDESEDVLETYPLPGAEGIDDPYLNEVWQEVVQDLDLVGNTNGNQSPPARPNKNNTVKKAVRKRTGKKGKAR